MICQKSHFRKSFFPPNATSGFRVGFPSSASKTFARDCPFLFILKPPYGIDNLDMGHPVHKMGNPVWEMTNPVRLPLVFESLDSPFEKQMGNLVRTRNLIKMVNLVRKMSDSVRKWAIPRGKWVILCGPWVISCWFLSKAIAWLTF